MTDPGRPFPDPTPAQPGGYGPSGPAPRLGAPATGYGRPHPVPEPGVAAPGYGPPYPGQAGAPGYGPPYPGPVEAPGYGPHAAAPVDPARAPTVLLPAAPSRRHASRSATVGLFCGIGVLALCCGGIATVVFKLVGPTDDPVAGGAVPAASTSAAGPAGDDSSVIAVPEPPADSPEPAAIGSPRPSRATSATATRATTPPARPPSIAPPIVPSPGLPPIVPAQQRVRQGAPCSPAGAIGFTKKGKRMVCGPSANDASNRWRPA